VSDHLGDQLALVPALAAAVEASDTLRIGALVACNDYRHPVVHAKELATLDVLSGGRIDWGIGAGWLAQEYEQAGIEFAPAATRVDRLREAVAMMKGLFADGACTFDGVHYRVHDLDGRPKPVQRPHPPLLIGAAHERLLSFAAREAQMVGIAPSMSSRRVGTIPPRQPVEAAVDEQIGWIRTAAGSRHAGIELHMVAFPVIVTNDSASAAARVAEHMGLTADEVLRSPHAWIGTTGEIAGALERHRERWGVSYWSVPAPVLDAVAPVIARLSGR
jgi:probable F420-dependent oxidoreductase